MSQTLEGWLEALGCGEYSAALRKEGCRSVEDLTLLEESNIKELGVKLFDRRKIWRAIEGLRGDPALPSPATTLGLSSSQGSAGTPTPDSADSAGLAEDAFPTQSLTLGVGNREPRFNRPDPSARSLTWSQASDCDDDDDRSIHQPSYTDDWRSAKVPRLGPPAQQPAAATAASAPAVAPAGPVYKDAVQVMLAQLKVLYERDLISEAKYTSRQRQILAGAVSTPICFCLSVVLLALLSTHVLHNYRGAAWKSSCRESKSSRA
eukprot:COSAG05_NODE_2110_length_3549_cov_2.493043_2_plen_263_part_00